MILKSILLAVAVILLVLFLSPIKVFFSKSEEETKLKIKYLFLSFKPLEKKQKKQKKKKAKKAKKKKSSSKPKKPIENKEINKKKDLKELLQVGLLALKSGGKVFHRVLKSVKIYDVEVYWLISGNDAFETATSYAKAQAAVHSVYGFLDSILNLEVKKFDITPDFISGNKENSKLDFSLKASITVWRALVIGIIFIVKLIKLILKNKKENSASEPKKEAS